MDEERKVFNGIVNSSYKYKLTLWSSLCPVGKDNEITRRGFSDLFGFLTKFFGFFY